MRRIIKSFVLRTGRVSNRQQHALDNWLQDYSLPCDKSPWDFSALFGREAPVIVEIGFGMGASLFAMAQAHPETDFIGIEVHLAGVGSLAADVHDHDLHNIRLVSQDAVEVFQQQIATASLDGIQIFFPDPWHKKRHNKRRLIQTDFVRLLSDRLKPGGFLHCATDWEDYAEHMMSVLSAEPTLCNTQPTGQFAPRPDSRPLTKFEQRGQRLGHGVWDLIFKKS
ncbi:tRNA (guanosine(46)-N7)-methyltransferase TrmB [Legionella sp. CNM-4043-24]|uniref:tRNA (guanosine(46)-N7)-methyltransferase TrmB n=1 Tax=Legionella sp. CNM-4043-24 TaxID=3421646 RepID=UPI00403A92C1